MSWYVPSTVNSIVDELIIYSTPGTYTLNIPPGVQSIKYEIIGAGGDNFYGATRAGSGGYIKGTITLPPSTASIKIVVGAVGNEVFNPSVPSGATYINIPTTGPLFVMAGAGGCPTNAAGNQTGGWGGGWISLPPSDQVAIGGDGTSSGDGVGAQGGQINGGGAAGSCAPFLPGVPGNGRPIPENFEQASGGFGDLAPGGSGYTGGGSGCASGGGSSYYNSTYTTVTSSYPGNLLPSDLLPQYGRGYKSGYASIEIIFN
jgi:hypothetical protein